MKPNGLFVMGKKSVIPAHWIYDSDNNKEVYEKAISEAYEALEDEDDEDEIDEDHRMMAWKRNMDDPSFWAARGKRDTMDDFFAAR